MPESVFGNPFWIRGSSEFSGRIPNEPQSLKGMEKRYIFKQATKGIFRAKLYKNEAWIWSSFGEWVLWHDARLKLLYKMYWVTSNTAAGLFSTGILDKMIGFA